MIKIKRQTSRAKEKTRGKRDGKMGGSLFVGERAEIEKEGGVRHSQLGFASLISASCHKA